MRIALIPPYLLIHQRPQENSQYGGCNPGAINESGCHLQFEDGGKEM